MLELQNIQKSFSGKIVLKNVSLVVPQGKTHALIGSSGSGKTTLLRIALGLIPFDSGEANINGQSLRLSNSIEWSRRIGYVPQEGGLFPHLNGKNNVTLLARLYKWKPSRIEERLSELVSLVGLEASLLKKFPSELSGGQKQRVAIMRAAFLNPPVMLLDEPMGALDPLIRRDLQQELKSIFTRLQKTVVLVTHDLSEAVYLAESITLLHQGQVMQTGTYQEMLNNPVDPFVSDFINAQRGLPA